MPGQSASKSTSSPFAYSWNVAKMPLLVFLSGRLRPELQYEHSWASLISSRNAMRVTGRVVQRTNQIWFKDRFILHRCMAAYEPCPPDF